VLPETHLDLVRVGIAAYGVEPGPELVARSGLALRPVMTLRASLAAVKALDAGAGVSYGWTWSAPAPTTVGLVPLGYADGIPRIASNRGQVGFRGGRAPVRGRVCMDQLVVDLGGEVLPPGTEVLLFGPGDRGEPTAQDWAAALGTISYEIVTRVGGRFERRHVDSEVAAR
jgi:alanine racemase